MKHVDVWRWRYEDPETGTERVTPYHMTAQEAQQRFPGAEPVEGTREVRDLPDRPNEWQTAGRPRR